MMIRSSFEGLKLRFTSFRSGLPFSKVHFKGRTHFEDLGTGIPIEKSAIVFSLDFGFRMKTPAPTSLPELWSLEVCF
ncbi:hypothetical protein RIR_jg28030.t1 [Rhizophagus irregularis DAOM 181602=DAOM 197198]|nr:hypothetical protein RIR_jg28030.t1 [Rhizophagus irregularis DAOM 181602=DAOM 197198]